jgi:hypothetical protein
MVAGIPARAISVAAVSPANPPPNNYFLFINSYITQPKLILVGHPTYLMGQKYIFVCWLAIQHILYIDFNAYIILVKWRVNLLYHLSRISFVHCCHCFKICVSSCPSLISSIVPNLVRCHPTMLSRS